MLTARAGDGREPRRAGVPNPASPRAAASPPARAEWRRGTQPHRPRSSKQAHRKPACPPAEKTRPAAFRDFSAGASWPERAASSASGTCPQPRALPARRPSSPSSRGVQKSRPEIRGPSSTTSGGSHFFAPSRNKPQPPALDQRRPTLIVPIKGRHADTPWPVVDNFRRAFLFLPPHPRTANCIIANFL
jgi:hypothetical protein